MTLAGAIAAGIVGLLGAAVLWQWNARRGTYRPLSHNRPEPQVPAEQPQYESIDMSLVNAVQRRNQALDSTPQMGASSAASATYVAPMADDAEYARRYHQAHNRRKDTAND